MKKRIVLPLLLATLGLGGCIAVPVDNGYGYGPAVVVRPGYHGHRDGYRGDGDRGRYYR